MKVLIILNIVCFILFSTTGVLYALDAEWFVAGIWALGACMLVATGIMNYKTYKMRGH